jgi:hypothetical protein
MDKCIRCSSHAINNHMHGRDGSDSDLCDVCYWKKRYEELQYDIICNRSYKVERNDVA